MIKETLNTITAAIDDVKGMDTVVLDVTGKSAVVDFMVIATGASKRQVKALANNVVVEVKTMGVKPYASEGEQASEWILIDYSDISVHLMLPETRELYDLERLWGESSGDLVE